MRAFVSVRDATQSAEKGTCRVSRRKLCGLRGTEENAGKILHSEIQVAAKKEREDTTDGCRYLSDLFGGYYDGEPGIVRRNKNRPDEGCAG